MMMMMMNTRFVLVVAVAVVGLCLVDTTVVSEHSRSLGNNVPAIPQQQQQQDNTNNTPTTESVWTLLLDHFQQRGLQKDAAAAAAAATTNTKNKDTAQHHHQLLLLSDLQVAETALRDRITSDLRLLDKKLTKVLSSYVVRQAELEIRNPIAKQDAVDWTTTTTTSAIDDVQVLADEARTVVTELRNYLSSSSDPNNVVVLIEDFERRMDHLDDDDEKQAAASLLRQMEALARGALPTAEAMIGAISSAQQVLLQYGEQLSGELMIERALDYPVVAAVVRDENNVAELCAQLQSSKDEIGSFLTGVFASVEAAKSVTVGIVRHLSSSTVIMTTTTTKTAEEEGGGGGGPEWIATAAKNLSDIMDEAKDTRKGLMKVIKKQLGLIKEASRNVQDGGKSKSKHVMNNKVISAELLHDLENIEKGARKMAVSFLKYLRAAMELLDSFDAKVGQEMELRSVLGDALTEEIDLQAHRQVQDEATAEELRDGLHALKVDIMEQARAAFVELENDRANMMMYIHKRTMLDVGDAAAKEKALGWIDSVMDDMDIVVRHTLYVEKKLLDHLETATDGLEERAKQLETGSSKKDDTDESFQQNLKKVSSLQKEIAVLKDTIRDMIHPLVSSVSGAKRVMENHAARLKDEIQLSTLLSASSTSAWKDDDIVVDADLLESLASTKLTVEDYTNIVFGDMDRAVADAWSITDRPHDLQDRGNDSRWVKEWLGLVSDSKRRIAQLEKDLHRFMEDGLGELHSRVSELLSNKESGGSSSSSTLLLIELETLDETMVRIAKSFVLDVEIAEEMAENSNNRLRGEAAMETLL